MPNYDLDTICRWASNQVAVIASFKAKADYIPFEKDANIKMEKGRYGVEKKYT